MSFFHPDYTVGVGISPTQLMLADFTAGRESHPALKMNQYLFLQIHFNGFRSKMQALSFTF